MSSVRQPYSHMSVSVTSKPANRSASDIQSHVLVPAKTAQYAPGLSTRNTSRQIAGPGTNLSQCAPMNPRPLPDRGCQSPAVAHCWSTSAGSGGSPRP